MPYIQIEGVITDFFEQGKGKGRRLCATFSDKSGSVELVWFQGIKYITERYMKGKLYVVFGKPAVYGGKITIAHPEIDVPSNNSDANLTLQGYYNTTEVMKKRFIITTQSAMHHCLCRHTITGRSSFYLSNIQNNWLKRRNLTRNHCLILHIGLIGYHNTINTILRQSSMSPFSMNSHIQFSTHGHQWSFFTGNHAFFNQWHQMHTKNRFDIVLFKNARFHNKTSSSR